jgi:hypothetical protein
MDAQLSDQIQRAQDALTLSHRRAELVRQKMKKLGIRFGSEHDHAGGYYADGDITRMISMLHAMRRVAERGEQAEE